MAHFRGGDRPFSSLHNLLKMLLSPHQSSKQVQQDHDLAEDVEEPPDHRFLDTSAINIDDGIVYVKSPTATNDQKESLLTRALKNTPVHSPTERSPTQDNAFCRSYPYSVSGVSTAELTSDGGLTSPSLSNTPSPPLPAQLTGKAPQQKSNGQAGESAVEANLGRKRCISFACGRKAEEQPQPQPPTPQRPVAQDRDSDPTPTPLKRKTTLTFVCPARDPDTRQERSPLRGTACRARLRGSPAPIARKASPEKVTLPVPSPKQQKAEPSDRQPVPTSGLGKFEESEATRFHEFASSVEEDAEWVNTTSEYKEKITLSDCLKKELAIRKLGEEAEEEEALEEEDDAMDDDDEDEDEDDDEDDDADDDSTVHDFSSDDGNESDNEAGFADSDDESADGSEYEFWAPTSTTAATTPQTLDVPRSTLPRRDSNTSFDSAHDDRKHRWPPALSGKPMSRPTKIPKMRPSTPNLPDSTDFVCGTFDEDRPLEAAYKSCMEQRRLSKQILIPQDIDPSFPTSDPEDEDDEVAESVADEGPRGRAGADQSRKPSPRTSPKRMVSPPPPPRRHGRSSPRRLRSPPPPVKFKSPFKSEPVTEDDVPRLNPQGLNISELVQRPPMTRTKSLPRTPNPFFTKTHQWSGIIPLRESPERESSRTREIHTRGPIDIVEGLEKKRQKRKEKFWRQHCRKAAKEQIQRRPIPGKGAERMKDLGLAVAERTRAYGVGENAQLVLSV